MSRMSPFAKGFIVAFLVQVAILAILAMAFFSGGTEANPVRALIALAGMAVLMVLGLIGIKSVGATATSVFCRNVYRCDDCGLGQDSFVNSANEPWRLTAQSRGTRRKRRALHRER